MIKNRISCINSVGVNNECRYCSGKLVKHGKSSLGKARLKCRQCNRTQSEKYSSKAYFKETDENIVSLLKEGCGIRSIGRLLNISSTTVLKRILQISSKVKPPPIKRGKRYEMDEMRTFIGNKTSLMWIAYAIQKDTKEVVGFSVGRRTKQTLNSVIETLLQSQVKKIHTDKLSCYQSLIKEEIHSTKNRGTNYIERNHLTIRTHLKRLNRKTICFSKSLLMLIACLRIYFWA